MKTLIQFFILILLSITIHQSCSRIDVATSFADSYITNQLDKYFDINSIQSQFARQNLKKDITSIKRIIFPRAADELEKVLKETDEIRTWNRELIVAHEKSMKDIFYSSLHILEHSAVGFAEKLSEDQLKSFNKEFKSKTEDIQELVDRPSKARDKRYDMIRKYIEGWIGNLTNEQKTDLRNFCQLNLFPYREQIKNREKLARGFNDVFADKDKRMKYVSELFLNYESLRDPDYTKVVLEDQDKFIDLLVKLANKMTDDQINHLRSTLKDRIHQLRDSAEGKKRRFF